MSRALEGNIKVQGWGSPEASRAELDDRHGSVSYYFNGARVDPLLVSQPSRKVLLPRLLDCISTL
jgi:hypothetical protein